MSQLKDQSAAGSTRRTFIKQAAAVTAVTGAGSIIKTPVYGQNQAPSTGRVIGANEDRKSTRLNSSHVVISYAVFCLKKKIEIAHV